MRTWPGHREQRLVQPPAKPQTAAPGVCSAADGEGVVPCTLYVRCTVYHMHYWCTITSRGSLARNFHPTTLASEQGVRWEHVRCTMYPAAAASSSRENRLQCHSMIRRRCARSLARDRRTYDVRCTYRYVHRTSYIVALQCARQPALRRENTLYIVRVQVVLQVPVAVDLQLACYYNIHTHQ